MATLTTKSGDLSVIPEIFEPYVIERTSELSEFYSSGVIRPMPELNLSGNKGGDTITMPFWQDLAGDDQVLDSSTDISVAAFTSSVDKAVLHARTLAYGATDLAAALAGSDPIKALADLYAAKWARQWQKLLIQTLSGAMAVVTDNILDISGLSGTARVFDASAFVDANQKMGDNKDKLVAVAVHSAVEALMAKADLIDYVKDSEGKLLYREYMGKRVIVDDGMPVSSGTYTTYLFGMGAVGYGEGTPKVASEVSRESLKNGGEEYLISRRHFVLHPRGIKWDPASGVPAKDAPSNAEVASSGNWTKAWESQNIRIVQFKHKIV
jgi:hypothetical protein